MSLDAAMQDACRAVGIEPPRSTKIGQWVQCPVTGKARTNGSGRVLIFEGGNAGIVWNWSTGEQQRFTAAGTEGMLPIRRDPARERRRIEEQAEVVRICAAIVKSCRVEKHPYLERKGFPDAEGLVCEDLWRSCTGKLGEAILAAAPQDDGPLLVIPGRIGRKITTVQFITAEGVKKNILRGQMGGASHRIASGRETWVCEGIATAMSVHAALRLLGRSATVLCAFSASNVARVAEGLSGAVIAADHDRPIETLGGLGTGEYYAVRSGRQWVMPPGLGDWNDHHQAHGLRSVALLLRGLGMG